MCKITHPQTGRDKISVIWVICFHVVVIMWWTPVQVIRWMLEGGVQFIVLVFFLPPYCPALCLHTDGVSGHENDLKKKEEEDCVIIIILSSCHGSWSWLIPDCCAASCSRLTQQTGPTSGFGVEMVKLNDLRTDHRTKMTKIKDVLWCRRMSGSPLLCSVACIPRGDAGCRG